MAEKDISRRALLKGGGAALAGLSVLQVTAPAGALPAGEDGRSWDYVPWRDGNDRYGQIPDGDTIPGGDGSVVPWSDPPPPVPEPAQEIVPKQLVWEELDSRLTPNDEFFIVQHYGQPVIDPTTWHLDIDGLVKNPTSLSLAELRSRRHREVEFTLECAGNSGLPFLTGAIGNALWGGASLRSVLRDADLSRSATELVFWGADSGPVVVGDNTGIISGGQNGVLGDNGLEITEYFAHSFSVEEAMARNNLLCYEMNRADLPPEHGGPVRLIAPGWYGVANVKWLNRIEVTDRRFAGRFMARDYVTARELEGPDGELRWTFTSVADDRLKSAPAKVLHDGSDYTIVGVAWGAPIESVELSIDGGPWVAAELHRSRGGKSSGTSWQFWTYDWATAESGEHSITSRAIDSSGNVQPSPDDPFLAGKATFWESNGHITRTVVL